ncbi:uncharacterized protein LOC125859009 [Solanum stenotomum]|uniref:uncharacterized protein LOC125859009 n=1 Tax=Solanum stenotomum TaxID=172797 RepID=UPI0020D16A24|nr:uncharacterized protein LOC125859009 [Solanum stenotomum]
MTNGEIREAFLSLARAMTTQANTDVRPRVNAIESIVASRLRDFKRMNPPTFLGSKVDEDPKFFIDEVIKILDAMGVTPREKAKLASYQFKDAVQVWFEKLRDERPIGADPIDWGLFKTTFLDRFFPLELREQKLVEFMNLRQRNMSVKDLVEEECRTAMLHHDVDISRLMVYAQQLEETKLRRMNTYTRRFYNQDFSMVNNDRVSNPNLKEGMEVVLLLRGLGVLLVESNIWASILSVRMDALDVGVRVIR